MKLRKGQIVAVDFLDHAEGSRPIRFIAYGRLAFVNRTALVLESWAYADRSKPCDSNVVRHTIVRAAIKNIDILRKDSRCQKEREKRQP